MIKVFLISLSIEYNIPFPETLARNIDKFIEKFHISYEILFNYLLNDHFNNLHYEIREDDNEVIIDLGDFHTTIYLPIK